MLRRASPWLCAGLAALGLTACGSSHAGGRPASSNPTTLLSQTFAAGHQVKSGVLSFALVVTPHGSSELTGPLSLSLNGPFENRGHGKTPESAFTVAYSALGKKGTLGVTTTASGAYLGLDGAYYQLPSADFHKLQSTFGANASKSGAPGLSSLGIDPGKWVTHPQIVGTQTVDGVVTEHVHAAVDVSAFVQSLDTVLSKESSALHATGRLPSHIPPAVAAKIAAAIRNPEIDVWSGKGDSMLRRLQINADVPVHGSMSTRLGGLTSAHFQLTIDYSQLGKPQTIAAPAHVHSYAQLQSKIQSLGAGLSGLGSTGLSTGDGAAGSSAAVKKYSACVDKAQGNVTKMQRCATLLAPR